MDYYKSIQEIDLIISLLKNIKSEYKSIERKSSRYQLVSETQLVSINTKGLSYDLMCLDKSKKHLWKTILSTELPVSLEEKEYNFSSFHNHK